MAPGEPRASWPRVIAAVLLAMAACSAALAQTASARGLLEDAGRTQISRDSGFIRGLYRSPVEGDAARVRLALATLLVTRLDASGDSRLLDQHLSRLLAEAALGLPRTRVPTVADAIAFEGQNAQSFAQVQDQAFRRFVQVDLAPADTVAPTRVFLALRHAPLPGGRVVGEFQVRIMAAAGAEVLWDRGCTIAADAWERQGDAGSVSRLECTGVSRDGQTDGFARAERALRSGAARLEAVPRQVAVVAEARLPLDEAADQVLGASCASTGTCASQFAAFARGSVPDLQSWAYWEGLELPRPGVLLLVCLALQILLCVVLLRRPLRQARVPAALPAKLAVGYLVLVVLAHAGALLATMSPQGGGLVLLLAWAVLGLPLFLPGMVVGVRVIGSHDALRELKTVLGVAAVTAPVLELIVAGSIKSGWGG